MQNHYWEQDSNGELGKVAKSGLEVFAVSELECVPALDSSIKHKT